jgi:NitT/TauT family transport system substrate-binding protein
MLAGTAAAAVAGPAIVVRAQQQRVIKMASLRLIHSIAPHFYERFVPAGTRVEIITFDSPTDAKNAVVTRSCEFGMFGIAAATLGAAAGEPVAVIAGTCNKGMAVIAKAESAIQSIRDLRGKRVGIWPGSTQEVFIMERLRMEGMSVRDLTAVRVPFGEMHAMLARGDVDAYVGAEPTPGLSISSGVGRLVEYPYATEMGALNMVFCTHEQTLADSELVLAMLRIHRRASEFAMAHRDEMVNITVQRLGAQRAAVEAAVGNVELTWRMDETLMRQARLYAAHMLTLRQIRALPNFESFFKPRFNDQIAAEPAS